MLDSGPTPEKVGLPFDLNKVLIILCLILIALIIILPEDTYGLEMIINLFTLGKYCENNPSYYQDDMCFSIKVRCNVECEQWGMCWQGTTEGCNCDCGQGYVSICTRTLYDKNMTPWWEWLCS